MHGDAVVLGSGFEPVGQWQLKILALPDVWMFGRVIGAQQVVTREGEQVGCRVTLLFPPGVEVAGRHDVSRHTGVVECVDLVVVDHQITTTRALLHLFEFGTQPCVVAEEVVARLPISLDKSMTDEKFT